MQVELSRSSPLCWELVQVTSDKWQMPSCHINSKHRKGNLELKSIDVLDSQNGPRWAHVNYFS